MSFRIAHVFVLLAVLAGLLSACSSSDEGSLLEPLASTTTGAGGPGTTTTLVPATSTTTTTTTTATTTTATTTATTTTTTVPLVEVSPVGVWDGGLTVTEVEALDDIVVDFCLPGEIDCEPIVITKEECEQSAAEAMGADPTPIILVFDGTAAGGSVTLTVSAEDGDETVGPAQWSVSDGRIVFSLAIADEESQGVMSFTGRTAAEGTEAVLTGSWTLVGVENLLLGGDYLVVRPLEP